MNLRKILSLCAAAAWSAAFAAPVSSNEAAAAVANWLASGQAMGCTRMGDVAGVQAHDAKGGAGRFYVVALTDAEGNEAGYVVTSSDRRLNPVLAYSESGRFEATDENPLWVMLGIDVPGATKAMEKASAGGASQSGGPRLAAAASAEKAAKNERRWAALMGGARLQNTSLYSVSDVRVNTLLGTQWGQENHGENCYTPRNYPCGCAATAGAQIMRYWRHPTSAVTPIKNYSGTVSSSDIFWSLNEGYQTTAGGAYTQWGVAFGGPYDWDNMPPYGARNNGSFPEAGAIGALTLDVGRSVYMSYAFSGSGSRYSVLSIRLVDQFQYANAALIIKNCGTDEITRAILCSLDLKSPCGVSVPGHAIVADGYGYSDGTLYVHFNLGWSGGGNAWYNPPDLSDADEEFTAIDTIIYNIYPPRICSESGRSILSGRVVDPSGSAISGITVTAHRNDAAYTAVTDSHGIYALLVPAGTYTVQSTDGQVVSAARSVTVAACTSTTVNETTGTYKPNGSIGNVHGVEFTLSRNPAETPTFAPRSGTVFFRVEQPVTISCATAGAEIRYTLDGTGPTEASALYEGPISISASATIKARAFLSGGPPSEIATASYARRPIMGENLVQNTAPVQGETQTLSVAAPGTYAVSFDYAGVEGRYGEQMELRLARDGTTNVLASVAAASAGTFTTNFTFAVSAAGDWDLFVYNPLGGASQPVTFSNLAMFIPETEENIRRYWIYETVRTFGSTGEWNAALTFLDFLDDWICLDGEKGTFTPHEEQDGRRAVITLTMSFAHTANDQPDFEDLPKTAVRIVADETSGQKSFSLLTSADGEPVWRDVRAQGAEEPELNVPYTFNFVMDSTNRTFTAALVSGDAKIPLMDGDTGTFAFANRRQTPVESLELWGAGRLSSIYGSSEDAMLAFAEGDVLTLADGAATTNISAAQAAWLNSMAQYEMVRTKAGKMGVNAFADAWLMNLDLREERFGLGAFKVSKIEVTENDVRISVKLEREGAMQANAGGEAHDAAINGTLRLYGGATPGGLALLSETPMENEDFSSGDTALFVYPRGGEAKFFRPAIMPSAH